ncbi:hypothetical protein CPB83DRAFT_94807 [Crepidotus variabilis]|uniref:F-box domain-containing protein n=1 Tax=Crepidotus variabilis TaxID=179855 RepID=A0A9P6JJ16_9AGAR|nr:hypothetical protein CPB83DRAFT_94807 [Crepidotus variabilis]
MDLPPEIWFQIVSLLTDHEIWPLRCLNRVLWTTAWDRQCATLYLDTLEMTKERFWRNLRRLQSHHVVHRVREIIFSRGEYHSSVLWRVLVQERKVGYLAGFNDFIADLSERRDDLIKRIIVGFPNVSSLRVSYSDSGGQLFTLRPHLPLFRFTLELYAARLRSLTISLHSLWVAERVHCPRLEYFSVNTYHPDPNPASTTDMSLPRNTIDGWIILFLNMHRQTLSTFAFTTLNHDPTVDDLFMKTKHIPNLRVLTLNLVILTPKGRSSLHRFLTLHSSHLSEFNFSLKGVRSKPADITPYLFGMDKTTLSNLNQLSFNLSNITIEPLVAELLVFASEHASNLSNFGIHQRPLRRWEWQMFITPSWTRLAHLALVLYELTASDIDIIATQFPSLQSMLLDVFIFSGKSMEVMSEPSQFGIDINERYYTCSSLRYLTMPRGEEHWPAIAKAFPSLLLLNDEPRHLYLTGSL